MISFKVKEKSSELIALFSDVQNNFEIASQTLSLHRCSKKGYVFLWSQSAKKNNFLQIKYTGFVRVLENLESPRILLWHFPGLESPRNRPLILESSGNLFNSTEKI